jgi:hypothetical protein
VVLAKPGRTRSQGDEQAEQHQRADQLEPAGGPAVKPGPG